MTEYAVAYTATLLKYISDITGTEIVKIAQKIGANGISRLIHNAPMNALLPMERIAKETVWYYMLPHEAQMISAAPDAAYGEQIARQVCIASHTKQNYGACLLEYLISK